MARDADNQSAQASSPEPAREQTRTPGIAPGKVTRTSKLESGGGGAVQRKASSAGADSPPSNVKSSWDFTMDPNMDAAHRGAAVQRKESGPVADAAEALSGRSPGAAASALGNVPTSGGAPVDASIASKVVQATGQDVGDVRVHTGEASASAASAISARAFTMGSNIHLAGNESPGDSKLMAHELAHTIQQTRGAKVEAGISQPSDPLEAEADRVSEAAVSGGKASVTVAGGGGIMRDAAEDVEALLSYGAVDWAITDSEATEALSILAGLAVPELTAAMAKLGQTYKTRLLENLPEAAKQTSGYTKVLVALGPGGVQQYVQDLLSYGLFDWAVTDSDAAQVFRIFCALPPDGQATLATNMGELFRSRLAANLQRVATIGPNEHGVLRVLFDNTPDAEIETLQRWVALRFNLTVGASTDDNGEAWDKPGLRRCWDVLQMLPPAHVENNSDLASLTRYRSGDIEGWASDDGEAAIGYDETNDIDNTLETGSFTDAGDPLRGSNMFDATVRHEIGHRVDSQVGGPAYCATDAGGAWLTWDGSDGMAERLVTASGGNISSWADADQKTAIIECLQGVIDDRKPAEINARLAALPFCANHASDAAHLTNLDNIKADDAVRALRVSFSDAGPWGTPTGGVLLGDRIYQESYDWPQWVSYKHEARTRKVSTYQFRAPGEWFAEAYAAYYQPPGAKGALLAARDAATKAWFDANVDPQHGAGGTTPAAPAPAPAPAPAGGTGGP
jgi:hypothetical protein